MDRTSWIGLIFAFVVLLLGLVLKGSSIEILFDPAAVMVILGGTVAAVTLGTPFSDLKKTPALIRITFTEPELPTVQQMIPRFKEWATTARREGLLALESHVDDIEEPFLKHGMKMVIDGQPPEFVREMLEEDIEAMEDRHAAGAQIFTLAGTYAPTLGVLGAVMGLTAALTLINDIDALGPAIAAAFVATLLGIFTGYVLWHPIANKLKRKSQQESEIKQVMVEGILAIQEGVSARVIEDKLLTYVPEKERELLISQAEGENMNV